MTIVKRGRTSKAVKSEVKKKTIKRLYFDIETSYNIVSTWNVGYNLSISYNNIMKERAIICICYKWEGSNDVYSLTWDRGDDKKMITDFLKIINIADEVVGHNGDMYDIKFFRTRCIYHGVPTIPEIKSVDTLKIARREFRFNSNRLDYIGYYLGLGRKIKTDYSLWDKVCDGDKRSLKEMVVYCQQDVRLLEKVYKKLEGYTKHKTHVALLMGGSKCDCPKCGSTHTHSDGNVFSATGIAKKKMQCQDCHSYFTISASVYEANKTKSK